MKKQLHYQTQLCLPPRNMEIGETKAKSPRFESSSVARQWLKEHEAIRREGENIDRPDTKWTFEGNPQPCMFARLALKQKGFADAG